MKRFYICIVLFALTLSMSVKAELIAGYALFGEVPQGYVDVRSNVAKGDWGGGYNGWNVTNIEYTGHGLGGNVGDGNYLYLSFTAAQTMQLKQNSRIHIWLRKKDAVSANGVQISMVKDSWDNNRAGKTIPGSEITTEFQEFIITYNEMTESKWGTPIADGVNTYGAGNHIFRFCAANGETIEIQRLYIENDNRFQQSQNIGISCLKNLPIYKETSAFVADKTQAVANHINLYAITIGQSIYAKITSTGHNFDAGFQDNYQFRTWKTNGTENKTTNTRSTVPGTEAYFEIGDGLFGIGDNVQFTISARAKVWGQSNICTTDRLDFHGQWVNTPTGDVSAPTASAVCTYDTDHYTVTFTASDDSGDVFYYVENTTQSTKQISMTPTFTLNSANSGDVLYCYAVDFDGNMSEADVVSVPCPNCFTITIH